MRRRRAKRASGMSSALLLVAVLLIWGLGQLDPFPEEPAEPTVDEVAGPIAGTVDKVTDGDTIRIRTRGGASERVRLIGIDAPELSTTRTGHVECGGAEAQAALARLLPIGSSVRLSADDTQDAVDRYGRRLAYVTAANDPDPGRTAQEHLLSAGWAQVYVYGDRPFTEVGVFRDRAREARKARRGVWQLCGGDFKRPLS